MDMILDLERACAEHAGLMDANVELISNLVNLDAWASIRWDPIGHLSDPSVDPPDCKDLYDHERARLHDMALVQTGYQPVSGESVGNVLMRVLIQRLDFDFPISVPRVVRGVDSAVEALVSGAVGVPGRRFNLSLLVDSSFNYNSFFNTPFLSELVCGSWPDLHRELMQHDHHTPGQFSLFLLPTKGCDPSLAPLLDFLLDPGEASPVACTLRDRVRGLRQECALSIILERPQEC
jgi:hypothetical protein